jgi:hypothetical protein
MWSIIIIVFFAATTLRAAVQANGFNATTTTTTTTGGGGGDGGVSVETRLEYARDALAREMTTTESNKVDDDDDENDIDLLREQIERDVHPFKGKVTREMTRKAGTKYAEKNHRGFAFSWTGGELYLFSRRPSKAFNGHHERLIYAYLCDLCEVFGKTKKTVLDQHDFVDEAAEEDVLPPIEMALSTFDYNPPDEERLPVLCFCRDKEFPEETGCILHPGFGFRNNKIDETVYARREEFDRDFPWSKKDEKLVGRFSMYPRLGRHADVRARKNFVEWAENRTAFEDGFMDVKMYSKISLREHMKHKYVLHLDGQGHSFQFEEKLGLNSVVVSEKKLFQTYFSQFLKPNVHYLEFWEEDTKPEDVLDVLRYARTHDEEMQRIAKNGQTFAHKYFTKKARLRYYRELFRRYAKEAMTYKVTEKPDDAIRVCCPGRPCEEEDIHVQRYATQHF